jgi:quercetin dioxygenase-like cupin family protein
MLNEGEVMKEEHTGISQDAPIVDAWQPMPQARVLLGGATTDGRCAIVEVVARAGGEPPLHLHTNEDEIVYVLAGSARFRLGDEHHRVAVGDSIFLPRGIEHTYAVVGAEARLLVVLVPSGLEGLVDELAGEQESVGINLLRLVTVAARYGVEITGPSLR